MSGITWLSPGGSRLAGPSCSLMAWPTCQPGEAQQDGGKPRLQGKVGWTPTWQPAPCAFQRVSTCTSCPLHGVFQEQFVVTMYLVTPCTLCTTCLDAYNILMAECTLGVLAWSVGSKFPPPPSLQVSNCFLTTWITTLCNNNKYGVWQRAEGSSL